MSSLEKKTAERSSLVLKISDKSSIKWKKDEDKMTLKGSSPEEMIFMKSFLKQKTSKRSSL